MAKSIIDFSKLTFTAEQVRDINELIFDEVLHSPDIEELHEVYSGIVHDKEVGFVSGGGLVGKKAQGCNPTAQDFNIGVRKVLWEPKAWEVIIDECADKLETNCAIYTKKKGLRADDLTDTDYAAIVIEVLGGAIRDMLYRLIWFGDTDAKNQSKGGQITNGVDVDYFNLIDGLFKQLMVASTTNKDLLVDITANTLATKSEQLKGMTGDVAYKLLSDMYYKAPIELRQSGGMRFEVTQTIADAYQQFLIGKGIESTYKNLVEGVEALSFLNVPVIAMPVWDKMIHAYQDLGTTFHKPHRAVLIEKQNQAVGFPADGALSEVEVFFDRMTRVNRFQAKDKIDAKLVNDKRFVLAI